MNDFTYQTQPTHTPLETYEWDNVWHEQTGKADVKRLLYIGDSISAATRRVVTAQAKGTLLCDGFASSKALDNPFLFPSIRLFADQQNRCDAVLFNNGLHGWHLSDDKEYPAEYEKAIGFLRKQFPCVPLFIVLTTAVRDPERDQRVCARNRAATEIAQKHQLQIIDLHAVSVEHKDLLSSDGVHFTPAGYEELAADIMRTISPALK